MQQGMLYHSLMAPEAGIYTQQLVCDLHEDLDVSAFQRAWERVVERHGVLRTGFCWEGGNEPFQTVHAHFRVPFEVSDWRRFSREEQEEGWDSYLKTDSRQGFEPSSVPPIRMALFRMGATDYRLLWTYHHVLLDGWSRVIVLKEAFAFYEAFRRGEDIQLPLPRPYRHYIEWYGRQDVSDAEAFWKTTLKGFTPVRLFSNHRLDSPCPNGDRGHGEKSIQISGELTSRMQATAAQHGLTLNTLIQGAWAILLNRYGAGQDVVFGAVRACRRSGPDGADSMVGLLINTMPVRAFVSPETNLLKFLKELRSYWVTLRQYERTPLLDIQKWCDLPPGKPLFDTLIAFDDYDLDGSLRIHDETRTHRAFPLIERTNYPISVNAHLHCGLSLTISYDKACSDASTIAGMFRYLETLFDAIASNPEQGISNLPNWLEAERHPFPAGRNDVQPVFIEGASIHALFEAQAERTPERIAVIVGDQRLTYRDLNRRANQVAHHLRKEGVGREVLVAICLERSIEMVVVLLGILKAGGAYLPLDPSHPRDRLAFMLNDSQAPVVVTQERLAGVLPPMCGQERKVVLLDVERERIARESLDDPPRAVTLDNLAYVIYTSGSTGHPKGVEITHRGLVNCLSSVGREIDVTESDRFLSTTTLSFDIAALEIFLPLTMGASLTMLGRDGMADGRQLREEIAGSGATVMFGTPALWQILFESGWRGNNHLKVLCGGETLTEGLARRLIESCHSVWNLYGPTETTILSTSYPVRLQGGPVPVGAPIANTRVYVLDSNMQPVPIGARGEICIGGAGLARGYRHRPELTAERFVPDPFAHEPGARLYRTGDLGRFLPDGNIEFLGRMDQQVKIRGYRIELGEIEASLAAHPEVCQAAVIAREGGDGDKRLIAYVVPDKQPGPSPNALRGFLQSRLPGYMVPSLFVMLPKLPLTSNGKVDRDALPLLGLGPDSSGEAFLPPRDPLEKKVAGVWSKMLRVGRVGIHDNFFALGGHSLLAVRLLFEIENVCGKRLPLAALLQAPTVSQLSDMIRRDSPPVSSPHLVALQPKGAKPPFFCAHTVGGNVFRYYDLAKHLAPDQPVYGIQARGEDGNQGPHARLEDMAADYVAAIRSHQPEGPYYLGGLSLGGIIAFEMARQLCEQGHRVGMLALFDTHGPGYPQLSAYARSGHYRLYHMICRALQRGVFHLENLRLLEPYEKKGYLIERLHRVSGRNSAPGQGGQTAGLVPPSVRRMEKVIGLAAQAYIPPVYPGRITLFRAKNRPPEWRRDPCLGWDGLAEQGLEIHDVPGWHTFILEEPGVRVLARKLRTCLRRSPQ